MQFLMPIRNIHHVFSQFIDEINHKKSTWKAGRNFHAGTDLKVLKTMMGVHPDSHKFRLPEILHDVKGVKSLPEIFDARLNWPTCQSIRDIRDQVKVLKTVQACGTNLTKIFSFFNSLGRVWKLLGGFDLTF